MKPWLESDKATVSPLLVSFLAGAASASLLCWWWMLSRGRGEDGAIKQDDDVDDSSIDDRAALVEEDTKSRIGELPSKRGVRWPWDTLVRNIPPQQEQNDVETTNTTSSVPRGASPQDKTGLCIGSIFGLDVGGTLAKLVYFEQESQEYQPDLSRRDQMNHRMASAHVLLHARRGSSKSPLRRRTTINELESLSYHTIESDKDLTEICLLRQESMPEDVTEVEDILPKSEFTSQESHMESIANAAAHSRHDTKRALLKKTESGMKRSRSMLDLSKSRERAEALGRFYDFARRLDGYDTSAVKDKNLSFYSRELGGEFHFIRFETRQMTSAMDLIRVNDLHRNIVTMGATGGGAHKYAQEWEDELGIQMEKQDELDSLVAGVQFVLSTAIGECYTYREGLDHQASAESDGSRATEKARLVTNGNSKNSDSLHSQETNSTSTYQGVEWSWTRKVQRDVASHSTTYPYMLVTIGTGVSLLRVDGPRKHERVSGSTIGGGTYWGLIRLLTDVENFEDVHKLAERGDPSKVDMMVGDIYGKNSDALQKVGLPSNLVASSFGKLVAKDDPADGINQEDLARALLLMVTNNIAQVAYLNAKLHNTSRIYFVGNFLRHNQISQQRLAYAINYWSKGEMEALFLEHEGYFGALGAFLLTQGISGGQGGSFRWEGRERPKNVRSQSYAEPSDSRHRRSSTLGSTHFGSTYSLNHGETE